MADQIIDKRTVAIPGPIGPDGPRGPMNPDSIPTDLAIADWIGTATTATAQALDEWRKPTNAVDLGADYTGTVPLSDTIRDYLSDISNPGLFFPPGVYAIDSPIDARIPITAALGARFVAVSNVDYMLNFIGTFSHTAVNRVTGLHGGTVDGGGLAATCVKAAADNVLDISGVSVRGMTVCGIDLSASHAPVLRDIYVDGTNVDVTGIQASYDGQFTAMKIFRCTTGIVTGVYNQFTDVYIWPGSRQPAHSVGLKFTSPNSIAMVNGIYFDGTQSCLSSDYANCTLLGSGVFVFANSGDTPTQDIVFVDAPATFSLAATSIYIKPAKPITFSRDYLQTVFDVSLDSMNAAMILDPQHVLTDHNKELAERPYTITSIIAVPPTYAVPVVKVKASWVAARFMVGNLLGTFMFDLASCTNSSVTINQILASSSDGKSPWKMFASNAADVDGFRTIYAVNTSSSTVNSSFVVSLRLSGKDSYETACVISSAATQTLPSGAVQFV